MKRLLAAVLLIAATGCTTGNLNLANVAENDLSAAVLHLAESEQAFDNVTIGDIKLIVHTAAEVRAGNIAAVDNLRTNDRIAAILAPILSTNAPVANGDWLTLSAFGTLLNLDQWRDRLSWLPGVGSIDLNAALPDWTPAPVAPAPAPANAKEVAAFLMDGAATRNMNGLAKSVSRAEWTIMLDRQGAAGANTLWLYTSGIKDGANMPVSCYANGRISGPVDAAQVADWHWKLAEARRRGFDIRLWLFADDSSENSRAALDVQVAYLEFIVREFGQYASRGYCLALEVDEHFGHDRAVALVAALAKLHTGSIGIHQLTGRTNWGATIPGVDVMIYQYGFGKSQGKLVSETKAKRPTVGGRAFVGGEFHKSAESQGSRAAGRAIIDAGADGSGGGTL